METTLAAMAAPSPRPSKARATLIYPLTHQGRWAWEGLELILVGGAFLSLVVPLQGIAAP